MKNDYAEPRIKDPIDTADEKVKVAAPLIVAIKACPDFTLALEVQAALDLFATETDNLAAKNKAVATADLAATTARAAQGTAQRRWGARKRALVAAVSLRCDGSKDLVQQYGFGIVEHAPTPLAVVPEGLLRKKTKGSGSVGVEWNVQPSGHDFMVQHATDPANPSTYSTPQSSSKASFVLNGLPPTTTVHFRVLALDPRLPTGQTDFCAWLAVMVMP
jgi:hypothetical protein